VGEVIGRDVIASPYDVPTGAGSIIVVLATDAPLLPHQLRRIAQRATIGVARAGGAGEHSSGDIFIAFSTANADKLASYKEELQQAKVEVEMVPDAAITPLFWAAVEATEEAILGALVAAETMTGRDSITAHRLDHDLLMGAMEAYGRPPTS
jgi:D-aminopeptidase